MFVILIGFLDSLWFCKDVLQNYCILTGFVWILVKHVHPRPPPPPRAFGFLMVFYICAQDLLYFCIAGSLISLKPLRFQANKRTCYEQNTINLQKSHVVFQVVRAEELQWEEEDEDARA